jgi:signal peptidase II
MVIYALVLIIVIVVIDQMTKSYARKNLKGKRLDKGFFQLSLVKNRGAFRGLLKKHPVVLIGIQVVGIILIGIFILINLNKKDKWLILGLSCLFGGAIGNLIDRMRNGFVTDFFAIKLTKNLYYNLADMFIFIGAIITVLRQK